jgi:hypothetical protein
MKKLGVFLLVVGATALFNRAELSSVDEGFIFNTTAALVEKQSFQMDEVLSGRKYSRFSPLPSLFATPFYAVADKVIEVPFPVGAAKKKDWLLFACGLSSCVLTAWTAVVLLGLLRLLHYSEDAAVWTSLLWAFGTLAFPYSSSLFHQVMATLLMVYVVRFAFAEKVVATAISTALLVSVQLTLAATVLPLFLSDRRQWNRKSLMGLLVGIVGGFGLHVLTNLARGDHWLHGAYETETFTTPTFVGTVGLFFSSGKGLIWFAPLAFIGMVMLVPFAHRRPEIGRPLLFAVTCHCLVVIHWWAWHGSFSWGPRLLLPILPLMMIPIADLIERRYELPVWQPRLVGSVAVVSVLINVWAATQPMIGFLERIPSGPMSEWIFTPQMSPLASVSRSSDFYGRFESTSQSSVVHIVCWLALVLGGGLVTRLHGGLQLRHAAPWPAISLVLVVVLPNQLDSLRFKTAFPQRRNIETPGSPTIGELHFPLRGAYQLQRSFEDDGSIRVGAFKLDRSNRILLFEAPPMSVPVQFDQTSADLIWTLPGEGVYRAKVPSEYLVARMPSSLASIGMSIRHYSWLLLLLAVPLYFDWLLGGRRMKEPSEPGTEANA